MTLFQHLFAGGAGQEGIPEILVHQLSGKGGQNLQVEVVFRRGDGDHEHKVRQRPVRGGKVQPVPGKAHRYAGAGDHLAAAVGNGKAHAHAGGGKGLPIVNHLGEHRLVGDHAGIIKKVDHLLDGLVLGFCPQIGADGVRGKEPGPYSYFSHDFPSALHTLIFSMATSFMAAIMGRFIFRRS